MEDSVEQPSGFSEARARVIALFVLGVAVTTFIYSLTKPEFPKEPSENQRALLKAAQIGDIPAIHAALRAGADVNAVDGTGYSALHIAVRAQHVESARCLLRHGAHVDAIQVAVGTPLALASVNGDLPMVRLLLDAGAGLESKTAAGFCPLYAAV